ncbi:MAG: hypothetical protein IPK80_01545 [Nannocystis sp.]|nr:hypothetical protein [Nannocystis sp.]
MSFTPFLTAIGRPEFPILVIFSGWVEDEDEDEDEVTARIWSVPAAMLPG